MPERPKTYSKPPVSAREVGTLHEKFLGLWAGLAPEARSHFLMAQLKLVLAGEYGDESRDEFIEQLISIPDRLDRLLRGTTIDRRDLHKLNFEEPEIDQLSDADIAEVAKRMRRNYLDVIYWQELEYHALAVLEEKEEDDSDRA